MTLNCLSNCSRWCGLQCVLASTKNDSSIHGHRCTVCRTKDIYLESTFGNKSGGGGGAGSGPKERPKLNLTVKKDMGGKIMAQSQMAKGPLSGTDGFAPGWTTRVSQYYVKEEEEEEEEEEEKEEEKGEEENEGKEQVTILKNKEAEAEEKPRLSAAASEFVPNF